MNAKRDIAVLVGSLRKDSLNRKLAQTLIRLAPDRLQLELVEIRDLSFYDEDQEANTPAPWVAFRERIRRADGLIFVTPEYNRSVPGVLKNALDVGSRPYGQSVWNGKPGAVISVSPGALAGFGANHHLRQSLVCLNVPTLQTPEAYIGNAAKLFDSDGKVTSAGTLDFLKAFMQAYDRWVDVQLKV